MTRSLVAAGRLASADRLTAGTAIGQGARDREGGRERQRTYDCRYGGAHFRRPGRSPDHQPHEGREVAGGAVGRGPRRRGGGAGCGGAGPGLADGFEILQVAGRFALPMPLGESLLAGWLLARAGLTAPAGAMTVAPVRPKEIIALGADGTLRGRARGVPFAREAQHIAVLATRGGTPTVALGAAKDCRAADGRTLAGDASDEVTFDGVRPIASAPGPAGLG